MIPQTPPEEDSPDLTDDEVACAVDTRGGVDFGTHVQNLTCSTCGGKVTKIRHQLRRRIPHLYARVQSTCGVGHAHTMIFVVDWLGKA